MDQCIFIRLLAEQLKAVSMTISLRDGHHQDRPYFQKGTRHPLLRVAEAFGTAVSYALGR